MVKNTTIFPLLVGLLGTGLVLGGLAAFIVVRQSAAKQVPQEISTHPSTQSTQTEVTSQPTPTASSPVVAVSFDNPKKSAHYVQNTPGHGEILTTIPAAIEIIFNFVLAANSSISITSNGHDYGTGTIAISADRLTLSQRLDPAAPNGLYQVTYSACWPDGSCHDGSFQFAIQQ